MMNNSICKLANSTDSPVLTTFAATFISASEEEVRKISQARNKKYRSLTSVLKRRLSMNAIATATQNALQEALYAAAATDTSSARNRLKEETIKNSLKQYIKS